MENVSIVNTKENSDYNPVEKSADGGDLATSILSAHRKYFQAYGVSNDSVLYDAVVKYFTANQR